MKIAVLTSGGDAPGTNAALRSIVTMRWDATRLQLLAQVEDLPSVG